MLARDWSKLHHVMFKNTHYWPSAQPTNQRSFWYCLEGNI